MDAVRNAVGSGTETQQALAVARARMVRPEQVGLVQRAARADRDGDVDSAALRGTPVAALAAKGEAVSGVQGMNSGGEVAATRATDDAARKAFFGMLIDNGICPVQLHEDLLASLMDPQDGEYDRSKAFRGVEPGLAVDTTA